MGIARGIAILTVTSPIVINVQTTDQFAVVAKVLLSRGWQNLNIKRIVYKQWISLYCLPPVNDWVMWLFAPLVLFLFSYHSANEITAGNILLSLTGASRENLHLRLGVWWSARRVWSTIAHIADSKRFPSSATGTTEKRPQLLCRCVGREKCSWGQFKVKEEL